MTMKKLLIMLLLSAFYNCAELIPPTVGMSTEEWKALGEQTRICRKNQTLSFNTCLRGKGVRYSEFN